MAETIALSRLQRKDSAVHIASGSLKSSRSRRNATACGIFAANAVSQADRNLQ
jgi:hypothetical protein